MFLTILFAIFFLFLVIVMYKNRTFKWASFGAFIAHLCISLVLIPRLPFTWDISQFHQRAVEIAEGTFVGGSTTVSAFGAFQGLLYTLFTPQPETLSIFNGLIAVLIAIPSSYIAKNLYHSLSRDTTGVILSILFLPLPFLFLSIPMRDALTVLLFFTLIAIIVRTIHTKNPTQSLPTIPIWGMIYLLRPELALIIVLGIVAVLTFALFQLVKSEGSFRSLSLIFGSIGLLGFGLFAELLYPFAQVNAELENRAQGGAAYLTGMEYHSWFDFLLAAPTRAIYFQFAPFPLHIESIFHLLGFAATVYAIVLVVSAFRSLYECEYNEPIAILLGVIYFAGIVGYGMIDSNFGTNVRHRIVFDFLLVILASPVLEAWVLRLGAWVGVVPSQSNRNHEYEGKTQKFDRSTHRRAQDPDETCQ